jgi:hypothetical protein
MVINYLDRIVASLLDKNIDTITSLKSYLTTAYKMSSRSNVNIDMADILNRKETFPTDEIQELVQGEIKF